MTWRPLARGNVGEGVGGTRPLTGGPAPGSPVAPPSDSGPPMTTAPSTVSVKERRKSCAP
eukprot:856017-Prorocentrum_minimum.AAC.1